MLDEGQSWVVLIGIYLIGVTALIGLIYWGVRSGAFRKRIEGLKELINDLKGESWTYRIVIGLATVIFFVGYLAFRLWID